MSDCKADLHEYLSTARRAMLWKVEGLSEYDLRRPLTPTGTNLLGLIKHLAGVELGYFGDTFDRPSGIALPWLSEDAESNADMWATPDETSAEILDLYRRAIACADETINALPVDAVGHVPWWGADNEVTLHRVLVHMTTETYRHAGHADIVRELIDGSAGRDANRLNLPDVDAAWNATYVQRLEDAARSFRP